MSFCQIYVVSHPNSFNLYPSQRVTNIFENWLNGIDYRFKEHIWVEAIAFIWFRWIIKLRSTGDVMISNFHRYSSYQGRLTGRRR
jgi:hypothetical protein